MFDEHTDNGIYCYVITFKLIQVLYVSYILTYLGCRWGRPGFRTGFKAAPSSILQYFISSFPYEWFYHYLSNHHESSSSFGHALHGRFG